MALEFLKLAIREVEGALGGALQENPRGEAGDERGAVERMAGRSALPYFPLLSPSPDIVGGPFTFGSARAPAEVLTGHDILARVRSEEKPEGEVFRFTRDGFTAMDYGIDPDQEFQVLRQDEGGTWVRPL